MSPQDVRQRRLVFMLQGAIEDRLALDEVGGRAARFGVGLGFATIGAAFARQLLALVERRADDTREPAEIRFCHESSGTAFPGHLPGGWIGITRHENEGNTGTLRLRDGESRETLEAGDARV